MANIGSILGIASSAFQAIQSLSRPDGSSRKAEQLLAKFDVGGDGAIDKTDVQAAFDKFSAKVSEKLATKADGLFAKLDTDQNGSINQEELTGSIARLAEQLDQQYMRLRMQGDQLADAGFSRDDLNSFVSNVSGNFDKADADGNGKVSLKEILEYRKTDEAAASSTQTQNQNAQMMLQVMKLMQAYGINQGSNGTTTSSTISTTA